MDVSFQETGSNAVDILSYRWALRASQTALMAVMFPFFALYRISAVITTIETDTIYYHQIYRCSAFRFLDTIDILWSFFF